MEDQNTERLLSLIEINNQSIRKLLERQITQQTKMLGVTVFLVVLSTVAGMFFATRGTQITYTDNSTTQVTNRSECRTGFLSFGRCGDSNTDRRTHKD